MIKILYHRKNVLITLINGDNEALKKVEILLLSQELVISVHFGSNATRTRSLTEEILHKELLNLELPEDKQSGS